MQNIEAFLKVLNSNKELISYLFMHRDKKVIKEAIDFSLNYKTDLEDTLQYFCAKANNCILLTNDKKFIDCGIEIVTYKDFLGE